MNHTVPDPSPTSVLIIGAGQAGLAAAYHLQRADARFLVVDAGARLGDSWRHRWDSLRLFTPRRYDSLPGLPFPGDPDGYPGKDEVADYLAGYAERFALPVLTNTRVDRLEPGPGWFTAHTSQGPLRARQVIVATGAFQRPFIPAELSAQFAAPVTQLHSSEYTNPDALPAGPVLVVGAANSGLQIAAELAQTRRVTVAAGTTPPAVPQRIAGRDLFWWLTRLGLMDKQADSLLARWMRRRGDLVVGSSRRDLQRRGVQLRPRLIGAHGSSARFADGVLGDACSVVWATGFRPDYTWIDAPVTGPDGRLRHHQGQGTVPGLWFLGQPWQRTRGSALLGFVGRDAENTVARVLAGSSREMTRA